MRVQRTNAKEIERPFVPGSPRLFSSLNLILSQEIGSGFRLNGNKLPGMRRL